MTEAFHVQWRDFSTVLKFQHLQRVQRIVLKVPLGPSHRLHIISICSSSSNWEQASFLKS